jgi:hypothetical protein
MNRSNIEHRKRVRFGLESFFEPDLSHAAPVTMADGLC